MQRNSGPGKLWNAATRLVLLSCCFFVRFSDASVSLAVDATARLGEIPPMLFGSNLLDEKNGYQTLLDGELILDRSFRTLGGAYPFWALSNGMPGGTLTRELTGGAVSPDGSPFFYDGFLRMQGPARTAGILGVGQAIGEALTGIRASQLELRLSVLAQGSAPVPQCWTRIITAENPDYTTVQFFTPQLGAGWQRLQFTFVAPYNAPKAVLLIACQTTAAGGVFDIGLDEVRLLSSKPGARFATIDPAAKAMIKQLGVRSLRYAGGGVDTFSWNTSVGSLLHRGEHFIGIAPETVSFGLPEFLSLCEEMHLEPVVTVNILDSPDSNARLVEYLNGNTSTRGGAMRAADGRAAPWNVTWFELGNEPDARYRGERPQTETGRNYAKLARAAGASMRTVRGHPIMLAAVGMTQYALLPPEAQDDISRGWNSQVFDLDDGSMRGFANATNCHFYTYASIGEVTDAIVFAGLQSGGAVLDASKTVVDARSGRLPVLLTEHHSLLITPSYQLNETYLTTFAAGLQQGDLLMTAVQSKMRGAHSFNLCDVHPQWGLGYLKADTLQWHLRPAGLAFQLQSAFASEQQVQSTIASADPNLIVTVPWMLGNVPRNFSYSAVRAIVSTQLANGLPRVALINKHQRASFAVDVKISGLLAPVQRDYELRFLWLNADSIMADNENGAANVRIREETRRLSVPPLTPIVFSVQLPAHSLVRIDFAV